MTRLLDHFCRARYTYLWLTMLLAAGCVESIPGTWLAHVNTGALILLWIGLCLVPVIRVRVGE